jgi:hypothetical protein
MRRLLSYFNLVVSTIILTPLALLVSFFDRRGEQVHRIARFWAALYL